MKRRSPSIVLQVVVGLFLGLAWLAWGPGAQAASCSCSMAHEPGATCCCQPAAPPVDTHQGCDGACAHAAPATDATQTPALPAYAPVLVLAAPPLPEPPPPRLDRRPMPTTRARAPPGPPGWLLNRSLRC